MADDPTVMTEPLSSMDLERIMECPICKEIPFPPIFQCSKGHIICKNCKPRLKECPLCKAVLSNIRNFTVEEIVLASKFECPYKDEGCKLETTGELMAAHTKKCQYAPLVCPRRGWHYCSEMKLKFSQVNLHLHSAHLAEVIESPAQIIRTLGYDLLGKNGNLTCDITWPPNLIDFDGKRFLAECFTQKDAVRWGVFYGTEEESRLYRVKIILQQGGELEQRWTIPVEPIRNCAKLKDPFQTEKSFLPSCTITDLKHVAERFDGHSFYQFITHYEIFRFEKKD